MASKLLTQIIMIFFFGGKNPREVCQGTPIPLLYWNIFKLLFYYFETVHFFVTTVDKEVS